MNPLTIIPNVEQLVSQFLRDQPEIEALIGERVYTAIPKDAGAAPLIQVNQIYETKLGSTPLWIAATQMQLSAYGGTKAQAFTLARMAEGLLAARIRGVHGAGVVVGFTGGSVIDLPDDDYAPARPRYIVTFTLTNHPNSDTPS